MTPIDFRTHFEKLINDFENGTISEETAVKLLADVQDLVGDGFGLYRLVLQLFSGKHLFSAVPGTSEDLKKELLAGVVDPKLARGLGDFWNEINWTALLNWIMSFPGWKK